MVFQTFPGQIRYELIPDYLNRAMANYKTGNNALKYKFIESVGCTQILSSSGPSIDQKVAMLHFLFRFWVTAFEHHQAYMVGAESLGDDQTFIDNIVTCETNFVQGVGDIEPLNAVFNHVIENLQIVKSSQGLPVFYPVNKLIGKKVSTILRRCGINYLIYPYAYRTWDDLTREAGNIVTPFTGFDYTNVGRKGMRTIVNNMNKGISIATRLDRSGYANDDTFTTVAKRIIPKREEEEEGEQQFQE